MDWIVKKERKKKIYRYFKMSFSCFRPFGVWGVTEVAFNQAEAEAFHSSYPIPAAIKALSLRSGPNSLVAEKHAAIGAAFLHFDSGSPTLDPSFIAEFIPSLFPLLFTSL